MEVEMYSNQARIYKTVEIRMALFCRTTATKSCWLDTWELSNSSNLLLTVCYYTSGNLNELNMNIAEAFSSSLRQNNLTKIIAQTDDCLFIYIKFNAMDHAF